MFRLIFFIVPEKQTLHQICFVEICFRGTKGNPRKGPKSCLLINTHVSTKVYKTMAVCWGYPWLSVLGDPWAVEVRRTIARSLPTHMVGQRPVLGEDRLLPSGRHWNGHEHNGFCTHLFSSLVRWLLRFSVASAHKKHCTTVLSCYVWGFLKWFYINTTGLVVIKQLGLGWQFSQI